MVGKRKRYSAEFKAKVAIEALRGELTTSQLASKHGVHQTMVGDWKRQAVEGLVAVFSGKAEAKEGIREEEVEKLHAKIGQLVVERDLFRQDAAGSTGHDAANQHRGRDHDRAPPFSESVRSMSVERRRALIEPGHGRLSIVRQCELVSISRSSFYHQPVGETAENLALMRLIDAQFLETPWYGSRQMARHLRRDGHEVGRKRVRRLM